MDRKKLKKIIIAGLALLVLAAVIVLIIHFAGSGIKERENILALVKKYAAQGDYERALNLLDRLLIKNENDEEAKRLMDEVLAGKALAGLAEDPGSSFLAQSLDELGKSLERTADSVADAAARAASAQSAAIPGGASPGTGQDQAAAARAEEEDRARAEAAAQEARKREQEAELAKLDRELREKMEAVNRLVSRGREEISRGEYSKARSSFEEAVAGVPPSESVLKAQTWAEIAEAYYEGYKLAPETGAGLESIKDSQKAAQESIKANPMEAAPHYTLSKIYNDTKLYDQAVRELEEASKLDPGNYLYAYQLGLAYYRVKKYEEARRAFESVTTKLNPKFEPAFYNLGVTLRVLGNDTAAINSFRSAIALKADYVVAHNALGITLAARNDNAGAINAFTASLSFDSGNIVAQRELGILYAAARRWPEAERSLTGAYSLSSDPQTAYNLSLVIFAQSRFTEAQLWAKRAVDAAPAVALYHYQMGLCAAAGGDSDAALQAYARAMELDKNYAEPRINTGKLYLEAGFTDKALQILDEAYKINPRSLEANNNLGIAYSNKGIYERSVFHYQKALELAPRDTGILLNLAKSYVSSGEMTRARDTYQELLKIDPVHWVAMHELGKAFLSLGDKAMAKKTLSDLLAKNPSYEKRAEVESIVAGL